MVVRLKILINANTKNPQIETDISKYHANK